MKCTNNMLIHSFVRSLARPSGYDVYSMLGNSVLMLHSAARAMLAWRRNVMAERRSCSCYTVEVILFIWAIVVVAVAVAFEWHDRLLDEWARVLQQCRSLRNSRSAMSHDVPRVSTSPLSLLRLVSSVLLWRVRSLCPYEM